MKIFFIRHGETTGDVENRYGGDYDDHLSQKGVQQSKDLADSLIGKGLEIILSSSLARAQETSKIIADATKCEIKVIRDLKERNQYGILTGMRKEEAKEKYPKEVEMLKDRLNTIEKAESYEAFSERVSAAFNNIVADKNHKTIAIVSHGGPLRVLFRDILKWGELLEIGDCACAELDRKADGTYSLVGTSGLKLGF